MKPHVSWPHLGKTIVIVLSLVTAGFFIAWLRFRPHLATQGSYSDGVQRYEGLASEPIRFAVWDEIEPLLDEEDAKDGAHRPALSPDGRWLVFASGERGLSADLWMGEVVDGKARDLRPLYALNTSFDERAPAFADGALYFASNRPGGAGGFDLWRAPFEDGTFGTAEELGEGINGPRDETDPAPVPGGDALVFASNRPRAGGRGHDLFLARPGEGGGFAVEAMTELNSLSDDREPSFTPDGQRVLFASDRDGKRGSFDLFGSLLEFGEWLPPTELEGLNSPASERGPVPLGNSFSILFEIEQPGQAAGLFRANSLELFPHPGPLVGWLDLLILVSLLLLALLAWLAKRWNSVEVLYKCFLVSVVAHGFLMWWFRGIHPESEIEPLPSGGRSYEVRLIASDSRSAETQRERGGKLEAAPVESLALAGELEKLRGELTPRPPAKATERSRLARSAAAPAPLPERSDDSPVEPRQDVENPAANLADRHRPPSLLEATAPPLILEVAAGASLPPRTGAEFASPPGGTWESSASASPTPIAHVETVPERLEGESLPARAELDPLRYQANPTKGALVTRVAGPGPASEESFELLKGSVAELPLPVAGTAQRRSSTAPSGPAPSPLSSSRSLPDRRAIDEPNDRPVATLAARVESATALPAPEGQWSPEPGTLATPRPDLRSPGEMVDLDPGHDRSDELALAEPAPAAVHRGRSSAPLPTPARFAAPKDRRRVIPAERTVSAKPRIVAATEDTTPDTRFHHTPYRARFGPAKARALKEHGGGAETEAAVTRGLAYLARRQRDEGFWGDPEHRDDKYGYVLVGKTGLATLAFLGAGHTQSSGTEHSQVVERALRFLLTIQGKDSGHFGGTSAYSHGIATYALAEDYALTRDPRLREPLEAALAQILRHQNDRTRDPRRFGGWSYYYPTDRRYDSWPRVSITAWQVMALESARLGGLEVPDSALGGAKEFLLAALDEREGWFRYSHDPSRLNSGYPTLPGSTPAALFALSLLGEDVSGERFAGAVDFISKRVPRGYRYTTDADFVRRARGNLYFWYYGSLAMLRVGGKEWRRWNAQAKETLLDAQREDGSWKPISVYAEYAGDRERDAVYSTGMSVLVLEVYYRYFTPLLRGE
jgi:hypothetical protein